MPPTITAKRETTIMALWHLVLTCFTRSRMREFRRFVPAGDSDRYGIGKGKDITWRRVQRNSTSMKCFGKFCRRKQTKRRFHLLTERLRFESPYFAISYLGQGKAYGCTPANGLPEGSRVEDSTAYRRKARAKQETLQTPWSSGQSARSPSVVS